MSGNQAGQAPDLVDDDEFDEFGEEDWGPDVGKTDLGQQLWEEDWENSNMSDPFAQKLREHLERLRGQDQKDGGGKT